MFANLRPRLSFDTVAKTLLHSENPNQEHKKNKKQNRILTNMCVTYLIQSQEHQWTSPDVVVYLVAMLFATMWVRSVEHYHQVQPDLSHLDGRLFVDAEQEDVWHTDEGPFLIGPEHNDGSSLRRLCCNIKVGEANASQVGGQTNKNVPVRAWG